jgi:hypothetical protein
VLFVSQDGTINIAPMTHASAVCYFLILKLRIQIATNPQGDLALSTDLSNTIILTPSISAVSALPYRDVSQDAAAASRPPLRYFPPSSSNTLQPYQTLDAQQPLTAASGSSRRRLPHEIPEAEDASSESDEAVEGYRTWRVISGEDIGVVMRKRAEAGYGIRGVSALVCSPAYRADKLSFNGMAR